MQKRLFPHKMLTLVQNNNMRILTFFLTTILLFGCKSDDDNTISAFPNCLKPEIDIILRTPPQSPRASIELYMYQTENVYVVNTNFPDDYTYIYNASCELICTVGGIAGNQNNTCVDWDKASYIETLWTDNR